MGVQSHLKAGQKTGWQVQAYCLMRNHFHLVLETPQGCSSDAARAGSLPLPTNAC